MISDRPWTLRACPPGLRPGADVERSRRRRSCPSSAAGRRRAARRCSRWPAATRPKAGPNGRRASSSARRFCSSTPPGESVSWTRARATRFGRMASHVTHIGVHDHGFNNVSTYGNLRRLMLERPRCRTIRGSWTFYELALQASGAVQAARWSRTSDGDGYIYSFNGPHSLFSRHDPFAAVAGPGASPGPPADGRERLADLLLDRLLQHARTTARYNVYYGEGRDAYDVRGPRRAREHLQSQRRPLSLSQHPAGLQPVQHLDPRPGLDHGSATRNSWSSSALVGGRGAGSRWGGRAESSSR